MKYLLILAGALIMTGCASTHMKAFVGKDIRHVVLSDGQPENVMDMPDGTRAFQFRWGGGRVYVPQTTNANGQVQLVGNSAYYSEQRLSSGGFIVNSPGCLITYFARWNPEAKGWAVVSYKYPKQMVC